MKKRAKRSLIWKIPDDDFRSLVQRCSSASEVILSFGLTNKGGNYKTFKERIEYLGISTDHFVLPSSFLPKKVKPKIDTLLVRDSDYARSHLKARLLEDGLLEKKCVICGCGDVWQGKPLSLQLDHINGIPNDNRLENLRLLCPNCHSQTENFTGRANKKKKKVCADCGVEIKTKVAERCKSCANRKRQEGICKRPAKDVLFSSLVDSNFTAVGRRYGVCAKTIKDWRQYYLDKEHCSIV